MKLRLTLGSPKAGYTVLSATLIRGRPVERKIIMDVHGRTPDKEKEIPTADELLGTWASLGISDWAPFTRGKEKDFDWKLEIEDSGKITRRGSGAVPRGWSAFISWIEKIFPEICLIPADRVEELTIRFHYKGIGVDRNEVILISREENSIAYSAESRDGKELHMFQEPGKKYARYLEGWSPFEQEDFHLFKEADPSTMTADLTFEIHRHDGKMRTLHCPWGTCFCDYFPHLLCALRTDLPGIHSYFLEDRHYHKKLPAGQYIYLTVHFGNSIGRYNYITSDDSIVKGDMVRVPVGNDGSTAIACVDEVGYYTIDNAPYPVQKTKSIIGRGNYGDER